jgi:hypothetical protein
MIIIGLSVALLGSCASAASVNLDWSILTDFEATYKVDIAHVPSGVLPYSSATESGVIQADIVKEKLRIRSSGKATFPNYMPGDLGPVDGAQVKGTSELLFDGSAGVAAVRATVAGTGHMGQMGPLEFCVKVKLPPMMIPPKEMVKANLEQAEQIVDAKMTQMPPHQDVTIDGEQVAVWSSPMGPPGSEAPTGYVGLRLNGAPFSVGVVDPSDGKLNPILSFPSWKHGAGEIQVFSCSQSASTSAAKLLANPEASQILVAFDDLIARMRSSSPMDEALKSFPLRPSTLFKDAAAMELSAIKPDWKILTDFTATYTVDMTNLIKVSHGEAPYTSGKERGVIQADIVKRKLHIKGAGAVTLKDGRGSGAPPTLWGAHMHGVGEFFFDGPSGTAAVRARASANSAQTGLLGPLEFCVKVKVPPMMIPPKEMVKANLEQAEQMVDAQITQLPPHQDFTIDDEQVAVWSSPMGPPGAPTAYVGFRHNGAPFGAGVDTPPSNGQWHPLIKFPTWKAGAGEMHDFTCAASASTSAAMLVSDPQASKLLDVFDNVIAHMHSASSLDGAFSSSLRPSLLFKDAATKELSALGTSAPQAPYLPVVIVAGAAGAIGAFIALAVMKVVRQWSPSSRREALLANMA